ncbi:MAG TPA: hypothetical protein VN806_11805 [Caulobacteraceae bacterium]|nr:hypothetical protein [Caulobacteraceae bacterium]
MSLSQTEFVSKENVRRYEQELSITPNGARRKMLQSLMAEERAKRLGPAVIGKLTDAPDQRDGDCADPDAITERHVFLDV